MFGGNARYAIPVYQRSYSWERDHVNRFLEDLEFVHANPEIDHFFGFMLTAGGEEDGPQRFIDGQQRMTTAVLFVICARNFFHQRSGSSPLAARHEKALESYLRREGFRGNAGHTLTLSRPNRELFRALVNSPDIGMEDLQAHRDENSPNRLLADAFVAITRKVSVIANPDKFDRLRSMVRTLLGRFRVYKRNYTDRSLARRIFMLVNHRGRPLASSDLVKSLLFDELEGRQGRTNVDAYDDKWTRVVNNVTSAKSNYKMGHFLHHYLIVSGGYRRLNIKPNNKRMYAAVEMLVGRESVPPEKIIDDIHEWSGTLDIVRNPEHAGRFAKAGNTAHYLARLKSLGVTPAYPVILAGYEKYWNADRTRLFEALLMMCYKYHIRMQLVSSLTASTYSRVLSDIADDIVRGKGLPEIITDLKNSPRRYANSRITRNILVDRPIRPRAPALALLAEAEYQGTLTPRPVEEPTIEHIMPKKLEKEWHSHVIEHNGINPADPARSDDEVENFHRRHVDLLGNQTLLLREENGPLSNKPYDRKRQVYGNSKFGITRRVAKDAAWNGNAIKERQKRLASKITASLNLDVVLEHLDAQ